MDYLQETNDPKDGNIVDSDYFDENMREIFGMVAHRMFYKDVNIVFRKKVEMRYNE